MLTIFAASHWQAPSRLLPKRTTYQRHVSVSGEACQGGVSGDGSPLTFFDTWWWSLSDCASGERPSPPGKPTAAPWWAIIPRIRLHLPAAARRHLAAARRTARSPPPPII